MRNSTPTPTILPLNKPCDLQGDAERLAPYLTQVDAVPDALAGQHAIRRWEYAMALYAISQWRMARLLPDLVQAADAALEEGQDQAVQEPAREICDVGGAGSNFWQLLATQTSTDITLVDPVASIPLADLPDGRRTVWHCGTVESFAAETPHNQFDILTCISVIEHVKDTRAFFRACHTLLKPGGLLFLTTDYWDADGPDVAHFHWMRERIYNAGSVRKLLQGLRELGYKSFGAADWGYPGNMLYDYSVASLAVVKK